MPKFLFRIVALLLVPCLIADPVMAAVFQENEPRQNAQTLFQQQALASQALDAIHTLLKPRRRIQVIDEESHLLKLTRQPAIEANNTIATTADYTQEPIRAIDPSEIMERQLDDTWNRLVYDGIAYVDITIQLVEHMPYLGYYGLVQDRENDKWVDHILIDRVAFENPVARRMVLFHELQHFRLRQQRDDPATRQHLLGHDLTQDRLAEEIAVTYKELDYLFKMSSDEQASYLAHLETHKDIRHETYVRLVHDVKALNWPDAALVRISEYVASVMDEQTNASVLRLAREMIFDLAVPDTAPTFKFTTGRVMSFFLPLALSLTMLGTVVLAAGQEAANKTSEFRFLPPLIGAIAAALASGIFHRMMRRLEPSLQQMEISAAGGLRKQWTKWIELGVLCGFVFGFGSSWLVLDELYAANSGAVAFDWVYILSGGFFLHQVYRDFRALIAKDVHLPSDLFSLNTIAGLSPAQVFNDPGLADQTDGKRQDVKGFGSGARFDDILPRKGVGRPWWWFVADPHPVRSGWFWGKTVAMAQDIFEFDANDRLLGVVRLYQGDAVQAMRRGDAQLNKYFPRLPQPRLDQLKLIVPAETIVDVMSLRIRRLRPRYKDAGSVTDAPQFHYLNFVNHIMPAQPSPARSHKSLHSAA